MKKAMILIPLASAAENHQFYNAQNFHKKKAAIMIEEKKMKNNIIEVTISKLFNNPNDLKSMGLNANQLIIKDARDKIIEQINQVLKNKSYA